MPWPRPCARLAALPDDGWSLPDCRHGSTRQAYGDLLAIRDAVPESPLVFSPNLVRGMGYYTGAIFEIAHPASSIRSAAAAATTA